MCVCDFDLPSMLTWHVAGLLFTVHRSRSCDRVAYHVTEYGSPFSEYKQEVLIRKFHLKRGESTAVQYPVPFSILHPCD